MPSELPSAEAIEHTEMSNKTSRDQFIQLLIEWQPRLYALLLSLLANRDEADEVMQETNAVLLAKKNQFVSGTNFGAWARQIAFHEVQTFRKRRARARMRFCDDLVGKLASLEAGQTDEPCLRRRVLRECLDKLDVVGRQLLEDRYGGVTVKEIAGRRGQTVGSISQKLYRLRAALTGCVQRKLAKEQSP